MKLILPLKRVKHTNNVLKIKVYVIYLQKYFSELIHARRKQNKTKKKSNCK